MKVILNNVIVVFFIIFLLSIGCSKKPHDKNKLATWRLECELGIVLDSDCPVAGGWSSWTSWSVCQGLCDETGHRKRTRECINPPYSKDGLPCSGPDQETEPCFLTNCSVADFKKLVKDDPIRTAELQQLEAVPVLLDQCLQMECPFEAIEAALASDNTWQLTAEALWNALLCVKRNLGCLVKGQWGNWGAWSACGARCGKGVRWRERKCDTPPPSDARLVCLGAPLQYEECEGDQCAIDEPHLEYSTVGSWSLWGPWTECSVQCGIGIRSRKRSCLEKQHLVSSLTWGTFCRGQYDQLEVCSNKNCKLDGGWSGWGPWGACSQTCGAGRRSRSRSCTRPVPFGGGAKCFGPRTEVGPCHLNPCDVYTHEIALFNGDSVLQYNFPRKYSTFFHFYIRFMPLSPTGTLIRKGYVNSPSVRLNLHKWHVCLDVSGPSKSCVIPRLCSPHALEPAHWHTALITFTNDVAILRLNDAHVPIKGSFPCDPELENNIVDIFVGNRFHGAVQEMTLNFIPLLMFIEKERKTRSKSDFIPTSASNIVYDKAHLNEAFVILDDGYYLRVPCFSQKNWRVNVTLKPKCGNSLILFIFDSISGYWILMSLQNSRLKVKLSLGDRKTEVISSSECLPNQWLDLSLSKKSNADIIEATINAGERLHLLLVDDRLRRRKGKRFQGNNLDENSTIYEEVCQTSDEENKTRCLKPIPKVNCIDEFFVGGVPFHIITKVREDITSFSGTIASLRINNELIDLHDCSKERTKEDIIQLSSRTASISGSYHETMWGKSKTVNLTCLYSKTSLPSKEMSYWLFLDVAVNEIIKGKNITQYNNGRILRLTLVEDNELRGFYTCRSLFNKRTRNLITYGLIGTVKTDLIGPDLITIVALFTTVLLVLFTLGWLTVEGFHDLRDGYGFFRDAHLSPEREAEEVCKFIDQNKHLLASKSAVRLAKSRARRKARQLASQNSFVTQGQDGISQTNDERDISFAEEGTPTEPEALPALPDGKSSTFVPSHDVYRCEPSFISSPRHGSQITTPEGNVTSSSSMHSSPRKLCSKLLMSKVKYTSNDSVLSKRVLRNKQKTKLFTIKSSTIMNLSPGQRILQKFQKLQTVDDA